MENEDIFEKLILDGGLEVSGIDSETGEMLYSFTPKMKDISPALFNEHMNHVHGEIMKLWEKGFVNIDVLSDNPVVTLTDKAFNRDALGALSKEDKWSLDEIKRLLESREL